MPIVKSTALEILSEPLTLLVLLSSLAMAVLAPAFHYHQFGEVTRMARDAGFSSLLMGGCVVAVFGTIRAFRRERESGTMAMALVHPISRSGFFLAKTAGAAFAYLTVATTLFLTTLTVVEGAAIGGAVARQSGDIARLWGPFLAAGVGVMVLPLVIGAACNRFGGCRFVLTSNLFALLFAGLSSVFVFVRDAGLAVRMLPVACLIAVWSAILLTAAAAFSVRYRAHTAAAAVGIVFLPLVAAVGNYYLPDALSGGGAVSWRYVALATLAALPALLLFLGFGVRFIGERDIS